MSHTYVAILHSLCVFGSYSEFFDQLQEVAIEKVGLSCEVVANLFYKLEDKMKFKIGDRVIYNSNMYKGTGIIIGYNDSHDIPSVIGKRYVIKSDNSDHNTYLVKPNSLVTDNYKVSRWFIGKKIHTTPFREDSLELNYKDIKNTRLARKLYPKANVLDNGMLRIIE